MDLNAHAKYGPEHEGMTVYPVPATRERVFQIVRRVYTPIDGDMTTLRTEPFTPSVGNLWAQPGVRFDQEFRDLAKWAESEYGIKDIIN